MSEYLDRKQVIELYEKYHPSLATHVYEFGEKLRALPTVERPHGKWKYNPDCVNDEMQAIFYCSICNSGAHSRHDNFCPNCGADMRKEGDSK